MKLPAVALLLGLGLGWLLWGRGPTGAELEAAIQAGAVLADSASALQSRIAVDSARWAADRGVIDSLARLATRLRADGRQQVQEAAGHHLTVEEAERRGDLPRALAGAKAEVQAWALAYQACDAAGVADSLALGRCRATSAEKDTALARRGATIDDLTAHVTRVDALLARIRPPPRWTAGALWEPGSPVPVGAWLSRRVGPLVVQLEGTGDRGEARARVGVGLAF